MTKKELKLKKGDRVYVKIPINATIIRVNKRYGYTLETQKQDKLEWSYFGDDEVSKVNKD